MTVDLEKQIVGFVRITNGLPFAIEDRHDGIRYTVPAGDTASIPAAAAAHMFGFYDLGSQEGVANEVELRRRAMQRHFTKRQGWNTRDFALPDEKTGLTKADLWFAKIKIEVVRYKMVPVEEDETERPIPADPAPETPRPIPRRVEVRA